LQTELFHRPFHERAEDHRRGPRVVERRVRRHDVEAELCHQPLQARDLPFR